MRLLLVLSLFALTPTLAPAETMQLDIIIAAGKHDRKNEPVCVPLTLPKKFAPFDNYQQYLRIGKEPYGLYQLTTPGLVTSAVNDQKANAELHFILKELKAGESITLTMRLDDAESIGIVNSFEWRDTPDKTCELLIAGRHVMTYMDAPLDESTKEKREATIKVFHHLYTPDGSRLATNGVAGQFPHHRGLFYGFRKITYDDTKTVDIWHCLEQTNPGKEKTLVAYQGHEKTLAAERGFLLARQRVQIGWHGQKKEEFAVENRELTTWNLTGGTLVEFVSKVTPVKGKVKFDGDPQHAGFHFRADSEVEADKNKAQTIFIRPTGVDQPGKERNWPGDKLQVNLPWDAMSFVLGEQRYTVAYLDHPSNPKEARSSERTYGRIGSYFVTEATPDKPLLVRYRIWLQNGQMKPEEVAALSESFVDPVQVIVKAR